MLQTRLLRTSTFRYAILYMAVFGLSVCGLLGFVYWTTVGVIEAQTDATIEAEIAGLEERYRARGLFGLVEVIRARSTDDIRQRGIYLLTDPLMNPLAGNLTRWPDEAHGDPRWVDFRMQNADKPGAPQIARARTFVLQGGFQLLVGRDMTERAEFRGHEVWLGKCLHCNAHLMVDLQGEPISRATIEHIVPRVHGGTDALVRPDTF